MKKQTAIDWLIEQIFNDVDLKDGILKLAIQQAKAMEKEQIIDAFNISFRLRDKPYETAKKHYNETYNS